MKLSFNSKSQEIGLDGSIVGTRVILSNNDGGFLPVMLPAEKIELSNTELEQLALEVVYQENFRDKYENEKFSEIDERIAEYKKAFEDYLKGFKAEFDETEKMLQLTAAMLNDVVDKVYTDEESADETNTQN
ncbi:DUF1366 domain-containing protein [Streptococcus sp.]